MLLSLLDASQSYVHDPQSFFRPLGRENEYQIQTIANDIMFIRQMKASVSLTEVSFLDGEPARSKTHAPRFVQC
jgi:hypothetical protein